MMTLQKLNELIFVNQSQHTDNIDMAMMFLLQHNNFKIVGNAVNTNVITPSSSK